MPAAVGNDPTEAYELSPEVKSVDVVVSMVTLDPFESATWHVTPVADLPLYQMLASDPSPEYVDVSPSGTDAN